MSTAGERLRQAREQARFTSARSAALAMDVKVSTYNAHERAGEPGARMFGEDDARRYGRRFRVRWAWLMTGEGDDKPNNIVPVFGVIGAGGSISTGDEQPGPDGNLYEIETLLPVPSNAIAFRVHGESMWPRYDHDDVIVCPREPQDPARLVNGEAAVGTPEGDRYLKNLLPGSRTGVYDLASHNAVTMRDVQVEWARYVAQVVRAGRWQRLDNAGKRRVIRKAIAAE